MADEVSTGELARRLDTIQITLAGLVGRAEYAADLRATEHRMSELAADIEDARRQHAEDIRAVHQRITDGARDAKDHTMSWRNALYVGVLPALVVLLSILAQIWLAHPGGAH